MSKAILFVDGKTLTIVVDSLVKKMDFSSFQEDYNRRFLDRVFAERDVFVVDSVRKVSREEIGEFAKAAGRQDPVAFSGVPGRHDLVAFSGGPAPQPASSPVAIQPDPQQPAQAPVFERPAPEPVFQEPPPQVTEPAGPAPLSGFWLSMAQAHIIVDDLVTGSFVRGNTEIKNSLALAPGQVINLSLLDPAAVAKSQILRSLIANGVLRPVNARQAGAAMAEMQQRAQQESRASLDVIGTGRPGSAEDYASRVAMGDIKSGDVVEIKVQDGPPTVAEIGAFDPSAPIPENPEELMQSIGAAEGKSRVAPGMAEEPQGDVRRGVVIVKRSN